MNFPEFFDKHLAKRLSVRDLRIIALREKDVFGVGENKATFSEIAKIEGVTLERVRQIMWKASRRINRELDILSYKIETKFMVKEVEKELTFEESTKLAQFTKLSILGELSVRTANCLKNENIESVEQLINLTEWQLLGIPNFGRRSLDELRQKLAVIGLKFAFAKDKI